MLAKSNQANLPRTSFVSAMGPGWARQNINVVIVMSTGHRLPLVTVFDCVLVSAMFLNRGWRILLCVCEML